jgi:predicted ATP-dependent endonuclease of OLD family
MLIWNCCTSEIELDQRSEGLQYFFSFYLIFLVESEGAHRNAILLLDEPGLHFHGTQQQKMIRFLDKLSIDNQILYTTHSPFMIDADHLERVRAVYEDANGTTKVSEDVWPSDKDTLFPLQAALGYSIAQTLFYSKRQVIVEGITDYWIFKSISEGLQRNKRQGLKEELVIVPAGGVNKLLPLASMLKGHGIEITIVLDGDEPGRRKGKEIQKSLLVEDNGKCIFIGDFINNKQGSIEDIFPKEFYVNAVKEAYGNLELNFTEEEEKIESITKRVESAFKRLGYGEFSKWRPARTILDKIGSDFDMIPEESLKVFEKIFNFINKI